MESGSSPQLFLLLVLLMVLAFFSMAETSLTALGKLRLKNMINQGDKGAANIQKILTDQKKMLASILIAANLASVLVSSLATSMAIRLAGHNTASIGIATALVTVFIVIFGDITPKTYAAQNTEKVSLWVAKPLMYFMFLLTPAVAVFNKITSLILKLLGADTNPAYSPIITEAELKTIVDVSHEEGVLESDEKTMITNVVDFGDFVAKDVMTPRTDIVAVPYDITYEAVLDIFREQGFTRLPVYKDNTDNIIGMLHLKDLAFLNTDAFGFNVDNLLRDVFYTYESKPTSQLFAMMRTKRITLAVVLDEYGGTSGIITLEDLLEEIVGDIADEHDEEEEYDIEAVNNNEYIVNGSAKITDVNERLDVKLESEDFDTIGGFVMGIMGRIPHSGDVLETSELKFIIEKIDKNRIIYIRIFKVKE